ncbi:spore autolysin SpoIIP [Bacillus carboniphilus]|uniref:Spore autolysin SpoIIP n=1 Tax=Bacillus carboniphilus TaxID=86663 RepID=A0ABN0WL78_9BACI
MKPIRPTSPFITINALPVVKVIGFFFVTLLLLFSLSGAITKLNHQLGLSSLNVHNAVSKLNIEALYAVMGTENRLFLKGLPEEKQQIPIAKPLLTMTTSIDFDQPKSFLGKELPGLYHYERNVVAPRDGSDYTDMPVETPPPESGIEKDAPVKNVDDLDEKEPPSEADTPPIEQTTGDKDVVYIYFTHNHESFLPHLEGVTEPNLSYHSEVNITRLGDRLKDGLEAKGIGTSVDKTDIMGKIISGEYDFADAYDLSRPVVQEALATNRDVSYVIDIHRDAQPREKTTIEIDGKSYAKVMFVYGRENPNYEENKKIADELHKRLNEAYPGISRDVFPRAGIGVDGVYNQDLHGNALLIEIGGYENTFEELFNTADAFAEVFSEFYWQAEAVNAEEETSKTEQ